MLNLVKIAVTGGVASGKSTVCRFFKELGSYVIEADAIVHDLLTPGSDLAKKVSRLLKLEMEKDGEKFRKAIAEKVFKDPDLLASLQEILHPAVLKKIEELFAEVSKKGIYSQFVVEIPLLFEIRNEEFYDVTIAVLADENNARRRFVESGFSKDEYDRRMQFQMDPKQKAKLADYTILNNGSLEDLKKQVVTINQTLHKKH